jgi:ketosteroid isomerase-like protein
MKKKALSSAVASLAALVLMASPQKPPESPRVAPPGTDARLVSAIMKANTEFNAAITKAEVAPIVEPYTPDAVFVSIDGTAFKGRAQIEQLYRDRFAKGPPVLESKIESEELMLDGDLAYERGRAAFTRLVDGKRIRDWARFLTIWQRQPGGDWKILRNIVLADR